MESLYDTFHRHFEIVRADTPDQIDQVYALRYQVYCIENSYEHARDHPDGRERDAYDARSVHSLVYHRDSGWCAGTVRLILPDAQAPDVLFPIEAQCGGQLDASINGRRWMPRTSLAEISRFAVSKEFKRRIGEPGTAAGASDEVSYEDRALGRWLPHITLGLFAAIVRMSVEHDIMHWYAIMEPTLLRLLTRFGVHFQPIGPLLDYHGRRQPALAVADEVLTRMHRDRPDVWEIVTDRGRAWPLDRAVVHPQRSVTGPP